MQRFPYGYPLYLITHFIQDKQKESIIIELLVLNTHKS